MAPLLTANLDIRYDGNTRKKKTFLTLEGKKHFCTPKIIPSLSLYL